MMKNALLLVLLSALMHVAFSQPYVFHFVREKMNWSGAQTYCRQHHTDLATINDRMDLVELMLTVEQAYRENVWMGLYRTGESAPWVWSDHSKSTFMPWATGQPNNVGKIQYCVEVINGSALNDLNCATELPSVCYTVEKKHILMRLMVKSSADVIDPSVKAALLLKIEQILEEQGLTRHVKLSWKIQSDGNVFQKSQK
ncbi:C-type lectin BML-1 [Pseudorasbora parva]|uniref:C-type lectin BML-1 n=1 Tax=Pseudorasbora parva TaxID=51549 RepID=UPI00351E1DB4